MTAPEHAPVKAGESPNEVHLVCCNPNRGLCGEDLTNGKFGPNDEPLTCSLCDLIDEVGSGCGARFCKIRQWLRGLIGWRPW